ncbi:MAG: hypothetical protein HQ515_05230 [Phycisphaeraceae bacterium]|nr:hypothetical protein [Phycisphaeraceae bacterium]
MWKRFIGRGLLTAIFIFGLFVLPTVLSAQGNNDWAFERVKEVQEAQTNALMANPGVVGTAIGSGQDGQLALVVLVERPGIGGIPEVVEGVPVKVVVTGRITALNDPTARFGRPVPIGVSTGHPNITAGTIGCRVKDGSGNVYALSNNHVYADVNKAGLGDNVLQPGPYDGGVNPADAIGTLFDFEPISFSRKATNKMDAAIAVSSVDELTTGTPVAGYGVPNATTATAFLGQNVQKYGRTTGLTQGSVTGLNATVNVSYGPGKTAKFVNQIIIEPGDFSAGGDSGSLIVTDDDDLNPVGLLFAGSSTHTIANPIDEVLERFGVTIDGGTPVSNDAPFVSIISPADSSLVASGTSITFSGTASDTEDGVLTASLAWTSDIDGFLGIGGSFSKVLNDGIHTITASVTDSGGKTGIASIVITVGTPPSGPTTVIANSITYALSGKKGRDLLITVSLVDNGDDPVDGSVSITISRDESPVASGTSTTGSDGSVTFKLRNASSGTYTTDVTNVTVTGLTWDGVTPPNSFVK